MLKLQKVANINSHPMKSREIEVSVDAIASRQAKDANQNAASLDVVTQPESEQNQQEIGGPKGLEPTRYGDWEKNGRCYDF